MSLIDEENSAELIAQVQDFTEGCTVSIHREHRLGHHQTDPMTFQSRQLCTEICKVVVLEFHATRLGALNAIDQGCVRQGIMENHIVAPHQSGDPHTIGFGCRTEQQGRGEARGRRELVFERFEHGKISRKQT